MNEQIQKLAEQAKPLDENGKKIRGLNSEYHDQWMENFAELIMKECIRVPYDMWDKAELNADIAIKIDHRIKDYFGVE